MRDARNPNTDRDGDLGDWSVAREIRDYVPRSADYCQRQLYNSEAPASPVARSPEKDRHLPRPQSQPLAVDRYRDSSILQSSAMSLERLRVKFWQGSQVLARPSPPSNFQRALEASSCHPAPGAPAMDYEAPWLQNCLAVPPETLPRADPR